MSEDKETSTPPKYSRYRSVRQAVKAPEPEPQPLPVQKPNNDFSRSKSMSRYRRSMVPARTVQENGELNPPVPALPTQRSAPEDGRMRRQTTEPVNGTQKPVENGRSAGRHRETDDERLRRKVREFQEREDQQRRVQQEKDEQARLRQQQKLEAEQERLREQENERLLAEQKCKDLQRLEAELDAAPTPPLSRVISPKRDKFAFFSRKRAPTKTSPPTTAGSGSVSHSVSRSRSNDAPKGIEQGGGGIVPQTDAPISASNAGERVSLYAKSPGLADKFTESPHPLQTILHQPSHNARNHTRRYYLLVREHHVP